MRLTTRARAISASHGLLDLVEPARRHIVDKAANGDTVRNERRYAQEGDIIAHGLLQILKWKESNVIGIRRQFAPHFFVDIGIGEGEHATVRVVDDDDRIRTK